MNRHESTAKNHSKDNLELALSKQSPFTTFSVDNSSKQGKGNSDEYDEVVSPTSTAGQYETMPAHQPDEQDHIYNKI